MVGSDSARIVTDFRMLLEGFGFIERALDGFVVCHLGFCGILTLFMWSLCLLPQLARLSGCFHGRTGGIALRPRYGSLGMRFVRQPLGNDHGQLQVILHPV